MTLSSRTSRSPVASRPKPRNSRSLPPREINGSRQSSALVAPESRLTFRNWPLSPESRTELQQASSVVAITRPLGRTRPLAPVTEHPTIESMEQQPMGCKAQAHLTMTASLHIKHVRDCAFAVNCDMLRMNKRKTAGPIYGFRFGDTSVSLFVLDCR